MRHAPCSPLLSVCVLTALAAGCQSKPRVVEERTSVARAFVPDWYNETPRSESGTIVKTAQAVGATPEMAETMATNFARAAMALSIETQVNVLQRNFQEQIDLSGDFELLQRFQNITETVAGHSLRGAHVTKREIYAEPNGGYRCFVRMELDGSEIAANYLDQLKQMESLETRLRSTEAWKELERRVRETHKQRDDDGPLPPVTDKQLQDASGG